MEASERAPAGEQPAHGRRVVQIDGLRAVAALTVVAYHYTAMYDHYFLHTRPIGLHVQNGVLGVLLFFAISGFVIFMTLDRCRAPLDFVVSRFARLFPAYWVAVALTWTLVALVGLPGHQVPWTQGLVNLSMLQSFFTIPNVDEVYWSLQLELIFYMWMLVLWVTGALRYPAAVFGAWVAVSLVTNWSVVSPFVPWTARRVMMLDSMPWFALGLMAYVTLRDGAIRPRHGLVVALSIAAIAVYGDLVVSIGAVVIAAAIFAASRERLPFLARPAIVFIGVISYPLYLVHENIGWLVIQAVESAGAHPWAAIAVALAACVGLATLLHYAVEDPGSAALRRWYRDSRLRLAALDFRRWAWAVGGTLSIAVLGAALIVTARKHAASPERVVDQAAIRPAASADRDCPAGSPPLRAVIVIGHSNAASHAESARPGPEVRVVGEGGCKLARDPLPGTTGTGASVWSAMLERLEGDPASAGLVLAPLAVEGARIGDWVGKGALRPRLEELLRRVRASGIPVVAVLAQMGESDGVHGTPASRFRDDLLALRALLDKGGVDAPMLVAKSTFCAQRPAMPIRRAVDSAAAGSDRIRAGADTDALRGEARIGTCQFSSAGREEAARLWANELLAVLQRS
jgi:peptidoglycan/LPS O-acetylase OafA/YrhL